MEASQRRRSTMRTDTKIENLESTRHEDYR